MRKSELEDMIDNLKGQVTELERDGMKLHRLIDAMAECLSLEFVPEKTIGVKYEKIEATDVCVEGKKGRGKMSSDVYPETCLFIAFENGGILHKESDLKAYFKSVAKRKKTGE